MTFNKVTTQADAAKFSFLKDQSTVLHTTESNDVNINGVNVITQTPTRGDVLCITRKMSNGALLGPDQQDIVWIKGLTVNYAEFPDDIYEPVGIVYKVRGRTAYVRYRTEVSRFYSECDRFDISGSAMTDGNKHAVDIIATYNNNTLVKLTNVSFSTTSTKDFAAWLASQFASVSGNTEVSAEYVGPNDYDGSDYTGTDGRCVVNIRFRTNGVWGDIKIYNTGTTISLLTASRSIARDIPANSSNVRKSGKNIHWGGCNYNKFLDYYSVNGYTPTSNITNVRSFNDNPVKRTDFENNTYCALLRETYGTYENYIAEAEMLKWPIGPRTDSSMGMYAERGAEFTEILSKATYKDPSNGRANTPLYGPAHYCFSEIGANHTSLVPGKWHLPSSAEMFELMQGITYGTNAWSSNPDIIHQVMYKLNDNTYDASKGFRFSLLSASTYRWTSTRCNQDYAYLYSGYYGFIGSYHFCYSFSVSPITLLTF